MARIIPTALGFFFIATTGCGKDERIDGGGGESGYKATIRETSYGIPHILAGDMASAAAGLGYVGARDYGCILLDQIVRVRSERARYFGPGTQNVNLDSDFGMLALDIRDERKARPRPAIGRAGSGVEGFVAGFNHYLETGKLSAECDGRSGRSRSAPTISSATTTGSRSSRAATRCFRQLRPRRRRAGRRPHSRPTQRTCPPSRRPTSAATAGRSARRRARPGAACCSPIRISPGKAIAAFTRATSPCPASSTSTARRCSARP